MSRQRRSPIGDMQRLRHRPGEMLRSRDLRDQAAMDAELRWWHNTAVHNAFGVSVGLQSEIASDEVTVEPGLAYDVFGRELWLNERASLRLPSEAADGSSLVLLARYRQSPCECHGQESEGSCLPGGRRGRNEQLQLILAKAERPGPQAGVVLAKLVFSASVWRIEPLPYRARPFAGPYVGSGRTIPSQTIWTEREVAQLGGLVRVFWTEIDTSAAGFTQIPSYFAWINGPRLLSVPAGGDIAGLLWPLYLENSLPQGFHFAIGFVPLGKIWRLAGSAVIAALRSECYVSWLGIERLPAKARAGTR
jgi:hypothetical protein